MIKLCLLEAQPYFEIHNIFELIFNLNISSKMQDNDYTD